MSDQISMVDGTETGAPVAVKTAASSRARRRTVAAKLLQAAALATVLVPLGSIKADANPCSFNGSGSNCAIVGAGAEGFGFFDFADPTYKLALGFDDVRGEFSVTIVAHELTEAEMLAKMVNYPDFRPIPIGSNPAAPFIDFEVTQAPAPCIVSDQNDCADAENTWISKGARGPDADLGYNLRFYWTADTDGMFPNPHVLHATGGNEVYDAGPGGDITDPNFPYTTLVPCVVFDTCESEFGPTDPAIGGRDDMFTEFALADATDVPEPASLVLLGTGVSGWLYRRRRNRKA